MPGPSTSMKSLYFFGTANRGLATTYSMKHLLYDRVMSGACDVADLKRSFFIADSDRV